MRALELRRLIMGFSDAQPALHITSHHAIPLACSNPRAVGMPSRRQSRHAPSTTGTDVRNCCATTGHRVYSRSIETPSRTAAAHFRPMPACIQLSSMAPLFSSYIMILASFYRVQTALSTVYKQRCQRSISHKLFY